MSRQLILLAGPSGSGKSRLARRSGAVAIRLDDFYRDGDEPGLPRIGDLIDWDDVGTWRVDDAVAAMRQLLRTGATTLPLYSIADNAAVGEHEITAGPDDMLIAEGIFAPELYAALREAEVPARGLYLDRPSLLVFGLRLRRDLAEHRKPPLVLLTRGWRLMSHDRELRDRCRQLGFALATMRRAEALIDRWTT